VGTPKAAAANVRSSASGQAGGQGVTANNQQGFSFQAPKSNGADRPFATHVNPLAQAREKKKKNQEIFFFFFIS